MGQERFERLEEMLPAGRSILGIDEHTACIFEQGGAFIRVMGAGSATVINDGKTTVVPAGETFALALLRASK
jgi:cyanophycinase-like exopeptidase